MPEVRDRFLRADLLVPLPQERGAMYDFLREALLRLALEKIGFSKLGGLLRQGFGPVMRTAIFRTVFCLAAAWIVGAIVGWYAHGASMSAGEAQKPCREEVISVDGARGPVSCSHAEQVGELKDGYLICKCKKK